MNGFEFHILDVMLIAMPEYKTGETPFTDRSTPGYQTRHQHAMPSTSLTAEHVGVGFHHAARLQMRGNNRPSQSYEVIQGDSVIASSYPFLRGLNKSKGKSNSTCRSPTGTSGGRNSRGLSPSEYSMV